MSEKAGHDRDGVFDDEDARPGRAPHRDDGWREQGYRRDGDVPEQVPAGPGLFTHALESSALVVAAALLIAWAVPHAVSWQLLTLGMACITAVTFWTAVRVTGSLFLSGYLLTWGVFLTAWLTWERFAGPWHEIVLGGLFIPAAVLAPAGAVAVGHHKEAVERARRTDADRAAARELRRWERILDRHGAPGCTVLDVRELRDGGMEVRGRLGKATDSRRAITYDTLCQAAPEIAVSQRSDRDGAYFSQPPDASAADFILHVRPKRHGERPAVHLPMEDRPLTVNRPMGFGVLDNGREYRLLLREVCVLIIGVRDAGKALPIPTPLATPAGWTTMGEIQPGDQVFDETGKPCTVIAATEVMHGRPCYEIEFSDGTTITADANHQWLVDTDASRRSARRKPKPRKTTWLTGPDQSHLRKRPEILTTEQMIPGLRVLRRSAVTPDGGVNNYSVRLAAPLQCPQADLSVPPYTLGIWLGDGTTLTGVVTSADPDVLAEITAEGESAWLVPSSVKGYVPGAKPEFGCALADLSCSPTGKPIGRYLCANHYSLERRAGRLDQWPLMQQRDQDWQDVRASYRIEGLTERLRATGVLGNKHIPDVYQRASETQRRALLAGLLDSDGYCDKRSGGVAFDNTNERLARDVYRLVCSLGYRASIRDKTARLDGKDCGTVWTVSFTPAEKVFRLPRKLARQGIRPLTTRPDRYITAIRPVPSVPVKCIEVDSLSHLYLAGDSLVPTHNSNLINVFLSNLAGCVDSVIWFVDMKGGRTARPWLVPWLQGFAARPVIDWVATTRPEAKLLLETALIAGDHRARTDTSFEKITPTADKPAIFIVCDDVSKLFGHDTVTRNEGEGKISNYGMATQGSQLVELYRSEAIDLVGAGQRLVNDLWGTTGIKSQAEVRFGLRVTDAGEGSRIFPDYPAAAKRLAHLRDPGSAVVKDRDGVSPAIQLYRVGSEERIRSRALWAGDPDSCLRPELEPDLVTALGPAYAERWTRPETADLLDTWRRAANIAPEPEPGAETDAEFGRIIAHMESDPEKAVDPRRARAREIVRESGIHGITVGRVLTRLEAEGMTAVRETVQRWFADDEEHGMMRRGQHGSRLWRWVNFGPDDD